MKKIDKLKKLLKKYPKITKTISLTRRLIYFPFDILFSTILTVFYHKKLQLLPKEVQLFLIYRLDFGHYLEILEYVNHWQKFRSDTAILILSPFIDSLKPLLKHISNKTIFIYPDNFIIKKLLKSMPALSFYFLIKRVIGKILLKRLNSIILYDISLPCEKIVTTYVKHLDENIEKYQNIVSKEFLNAYIKGNQTYEQRYQIKKDSFNLYNQYHKNSCYSPSENLTRIRQNLLKNLNIRNEYVIIHQNTKNYFNENTNSRSLKNPENYNILIDFLIEKNYSVVIQGRKEQLDYKQRKGLVNYAKSRLCSSENDLALFSGAKLAVMNKTGAGMFGSICNIPVLTLDFSEWSSVHFYLKGLFYPKDIIDKTFDRILHWKEILNHPCFYNISFNNFSSASLEYIDMTEEEIINSTKEFLTLVNNQKWDNFTPQQNEFLKNVTPLHMDMYYARGIPCDSYLSKFSNLKNDLLSTEDLLIKSAK